MRRELPLLRPLMAASGYLHRGDLVDAGWRPDAIRAAVSAEGLLRAGRQWILLPEVAPAVRLAAQSGGVAAFVSAAERMKLWMSSTPALPHLALRRGARRGPRRVSLTRARSWCGIRRCAAAS